MSIVSRDAERAQPYKRQSCGVSRDFFLPLFTSGPSLGETDFKKDISNPVAFVHFETSLVQANRVYSLSYMDEPRCNLNNSYMHVI